MYPVFLRPLFPFGPQNKQPLSETEPKPNAEPLLCAVVLCRFGHREHNFCLFLFGPSIRGILLIKKNSIGAWSTAASCLLKGLECANTHTHHYHTMATHWKFFIRTISPVRTKSSGETHPAAGIEEDWHIFPGEVSIFKTESPKPSLLCAISMAPIRLAG